MNILVLGHKWWTGSMMRELLESQNLQYFTTNIRPNDKTDFEKMLVETKLNQPILWVLLVVHTGSIGNKEYTTIDYLEQPGKIKKFSIRQNYFMKN